MTKERHYHFVDKKQVDRKTFERIWKSEGFGRIIYNKKYEVPPPVGYGRWRGVHNYQIRPVKRWGN